MPFYEYACQACGHHIEVLQKISDAPLVDCPECGKPELKKQVSAPGFRLKGDGWYETDFKSKNQRNLHGSDGKSAKTEKKSDSSSSTSTDKAKTAAK